MTTCAGVSEALHIFEFVRNGDQTASPVRLKQAAESYRLDRLGVCEGVQFTF